MKTVQLNRWLTLSANVGVLIGIFFLVAEMQQTNSIAKAEVKNSLTQSVYTLLQMQRDPRQIAALERSGDDWESLSFEERILLSSMASAIFRHFENAYYQHSFGVYDDSQLAAEVVEIDDALSMPLFADYWESTSRTFAVEFRNFVEQRKTQLPK